MQIDWTEFRSLARGAFDADAGRDAVLFGHQAIALRHWGEPRQCRRDKVRPASPERGIEQD
ncbi:hypothetical protein ACIQ6Y_17465 [Streptomyces sp. NPDC096205]|uniref:hypothetical protein n=1 Tax=Streptomyces sp. NPDC096205 TaxID=3366081 RepID=UPI0038039F24